ncbi:MAG TPA: FadR/GntR family transcriptional regulator [Anaeromyxobacteraceae bacterium]|nr:FadR/GntR family transcriptional regulator [Anaeromyxobacteraceae bacterium]
MSAAPKLALRPVRKTRVFEDVARQIQRLVADGALKPGDRLPPERELAERFGVSRGSVRDAIRTLEIAGLVAVRQGEGNVVADVSPESLASPLASVLVRKREVIADLIDVRKMLEPALAARAARRATAEEIARLEEILRRQRARVLRGESTIEEDSEFHSVVAHAARNGVILKVLDVLMDLLKETRTRSLQVPGRLQRSLAGHRRVLEAIRRRDPDAAERAVRRHLEEIESIVMEKL